jgi:hypothetical protein
MFIGYPEPIYFNVSTMIPKPDSSVYEPFKGLNGRSGHENGFHCLE